MKIVEKIKGTMVFVLGVALFVFIFSFDRLMDRPTGFGTKAIIGFIIAGIMVINGIRIFRR